MTLNNYKTAKNETKVHAGQIYQVRLQNACFGYILVGRYFFIFFWKKGNAFFEFELPREEYFHICFLSIFRCTYSFCHFLLFVFKNTPQKMNIFTNIFRRSSIFAQMKNIRSNFRLKMNKTKITRKKLN